MSLVADRSASESLKEPAEIVPDGRTPRPGSLAFVFPCLNEEETLRSCIEEVSASLTTADCDFYIIVADNGSTDRSIEIAKECGARVVNVPERGYGAALRGGIDAAESEYVMFADADSTYLYSDAGPLAIAALSEQSDMAIASRIRGEIEDGAMPFLHRYLGTPVLTGLINLFYKGKLSDCNSGFRCLRKEAFVSWNVRASGMEFASELLIKALKANASTVEIPSGLRCGPPDRVAHLRTWRDGMRHLLFILSERPQLFEWVGLGVTLLATLLQAVAFMTGPMELAGNFNVFDLHSQLLLLFAATVGSQVFLVSCMIYLDSRERPLGVTRRLIELDEGVLFFALLATFAAIAGLIGFVFFRWVSSDFAGLALTDVLVAGAHFLTIPALIAMGLLGIHLVKSVRPN